jgi:hypothetical protein
MNFLKKFFGIVDDWEIYDVVQGEWNIHNQKTDMHHSEFCLYEIFYSPYTKTYKLEMSGHDPEYHDNYAVAIEKLRKLRNNEAY